MRNETRRMKHKVQSMTAPTLLLISCILLLSACGDYNTISGEDYGDITSSPSSIVLTESEHRAGWGNADCLLCHSTGNIHQVNRTSLDLDMEAIREIVERRGQASCAGCHGDNGAE